MATATSSLTMLLPTLSGSGSAARIVCSEGEWSVPVSFDECDDFRITITGPGADEVRVNAAVAFIEEVVI